VAASRHESGLLLPPGVLDDHPVAAQRGIPPDLPPSLRPPPPQVFLPASAAPSPEDMIHCVATAVDLGFPAATFRDALNLIADVPFQPAMLTLSMIAAELYHHPHDRASHLRLAREFFWGELLARAEAFLNADESRLLFDPRHVTVLQRLVVTYGAKDPEPARGLTRHEVWMLVGALLAVGSAVPDLDPPEPEPGEQPNWTAWATYTVQLGAWHEAPHVFDAVARAYSLYADVHDSPTAAGHAARCDIERWMVEKYELTLGEQLAGGLACAVVSRALQADLRIEDRAVHIAPGFLKDGALAGKEEQVVNLISATREELIEAFRAAGEDTVHIAWDHTPFEKRPFLRLDDDTLRLISPRALVAWMTKGMHHRVLQAAEDRPHPNRAGRLMSDIYLTYMGALGEESVRRLISGSHEVALRAGTVRIHGEHRYRVGKRGHDSPDAALDFGMDLVLVEVFSGRIPLAARASKDTDRLRAAIDKATTKKLCELGARTTELLGGHLTYPDFDLKRIRRIWPLLVLAGDPLMQTPLLWGYLREAAPRAFLPDARVRRPTIVNLDDLEPLLALVQAGHHLPELLRDLHGSPFAEMPPRNWVNDRFGSVPGCPTYVKEQFDAAMRLAGLTLYPRSERFAMLGRTTPRRGSC
jgi:hypothetical protein